MDEKEKFNLNYKYELFPTRAQRRQLVRQMIENKKQWNYACRLKEKLQHALRCGRIEYVLTTVLSIEKNDHQAVRSKAIGAMRPRFPEVTPADLSSLYDLCSIFGKKSATATFLIETRHLDTAILVTELTPLVQTELVILRSYWQELRQWRKVKKAARQDETVQVPPLPKMPKQVPLFYALKEGIIRYADCQSKQYIDASFPSGKHRDCGKLRSDLTGSAKSKFTRACHPSLEQRKYGNFGNPCPKRRIDSYGYQQALQSVFRTTADGKTQIKIRPLPKGMEWVSVVLHRPIPPEAIISRMTIMSDVDRWYAVLSLNVSEETYALPPPKPHAVIALDPGSKQALTFARLDMETGEIDYGAFDWRPLRNSSAKRLKLQRHMSRLEKPDRRVGKKASQRWRSCSRQCAQLHARIRRQRNAIHHQIASYLAKHEVAAIGEWEPPRQKKIHRGPKGVVAARQAGRDRAIASLRTITTEKCDRAGGICIPFAEEYNTTRKCSGCGALTGPTGVQQLGIREWTCPECGSIHDRDQNAAYNILMLAIAWIDENKAALSLAAGG